MPFGIAARVLAGMQIGQSGESAVPAGRRWWTPIVKTRPQGRKTEIARTPRGPRKALSTPLN